jgi:hypothetical protein
MGDPDPFRGIDLEACAVNVHDVRNVLEPARGHGHPPSPVRPGHIATDEQVAGFRVATVGVVVLA